MSLPSEVDLVVVGGGISGAGVALEAVRRGLRRVLLVERDDFAAGASSGSSKLVHGGLRYLKQGHWRLTRESLREREQLLADVPGLVQPLRFALLHRSGRSPAPWAAQAGLWVYDHLAGRRTRGRWTARQAVERLPGLNGHALRGASVYEDACTDDARLTLRVLQEARARGALLRNYTRVEAVTRGAGGAVCGVQLRDADGFARTVATRCVVACAGAWSGALAPPEGPPQPPLRPLRGSHLLLPLARLPLPHAVAWSHPRDGRPVFAYPWLGALLVGTTDVDHRDLGQPARITADEQAYLLEALTEAFPARELGAADVQATWAAVRPVRDHGAARPSDESREAWVRAHQGWVALAGGKLTTFRPMAAAALDAAAPWLPPHAPAPSDPRILCDGPAPFGPHAEAVALGPDCAGVPEGLVRHVLQQEQVRHLDDLLLRRTRIGLLHPLDRLAQEPALARLCGELLGWEAPRWREEWSRFATLRAERHGAAA